MILASAPGKVVLWGEYAVLAGAPAAAMAVERRARCRIESGDADWRISTRGFQAEPVRLPLARLLSETPPPSGASWSILWHAARCLSGRRLPMAAEVELDTERFQIDGRKLGLGSSAAAGVAAYAALCRLAGQPPSLGEALDVHAAFQGGSGSGLDVAAAWQGGLIRFQRQPGQSLPDVQPWRLPDNVRVRFLWSGQPASTVDHVRRFEHWRAASPAGPLDDLCALAEALFTASRPLDALRDYVAALTALDQAADIGIFDGGHRELVRLADAAGVVYKPCGAGGGDLGAAFDCDSDAAARFEEQARDRGFLPLSLEMASDGIQITG